MFLFKLFACYDDIVISPSKQLNLNPPYNESMYPAITIDPHLVVQLQRKYREKKKSGASERPRTEGLHAAYNMHISTTLEKKYAFLAHIIQVRDKAS